jgi:biotin transporter BioY
MYYTVTPCRLVDTRTAAGPHGGPALGALSTRTFVVAGQCGVPPAAKALSFNITVTQGTAFGDLRVYPAGIAPPLVSVINYAAGQTRANNGVVVLGAAGDLVVQSDQPSGTVHVIIDVNGYFQ